MTARSARALWAAHACDLALPVMPVACRINLRGQASFEKLVTSILAGTHGVAIIVAI